MSKQREALEMALRGFQDAHNASLEERYADCRHIILENICAIREALSEPVDPVREAAPYLLDALEAIASENGVRRVSVDLHKKSRAAIANGKGESMSNQREVLKK